MRTKVKGPKHIEGARKLMGTIGRSYLNLVFKKPFERKGRPPRI